jgi:hypothetical protein
MNGFMLSSLECGSGPHDYYVGGAMLDHARTGDKVSQQGVRCAVAIPVLFATHFMQRSIGGQKSASGVPTISRLARPTGFARPRDLINLTGKSLRIFRNRVNPGNQKYSAFVLTQIIGITPPVSPN